MRYYEVCCTLLHRWGFAAQNNRADMDVACADSGASYDELRSILKHLRAKYLAAYNSALKSGAFASVGSDGWLDCEWGCGCGGWLGSGHTLMMGPYLT